MRYLSTLLVAVLVVGSASDAKAHRLWIGDYRFYSRAATAVESYARGLADMIRSAGLANLLNSEATKNYQDARSKQLDNHLKGTETYFEARRVNKSYRDANRKPRLPSEQLRGISERKKPARMTPTQFDPITGTINWPMALRDDAFQDITERLQEQFTERARRSGETDTKTFQKIDGLVKQALAELKATIGQYDARMYMDGKNFLESLAYEARFPIG